MEQVTCLKSVKFNGDIIITDPCYVVVDDLDRDDWKRCGYGSDMGALGIHNCIVEDTIYGDWSCTTFNQETGDALGNFCADSGQVGVFDLAEILRYNPQYRDHIDKLWTTTLVKNFNGVVRIEKVVDPDNEPWGDYITVVGKGVDKETGEQINFFTRQTGF